MCQVWRRKVRRGRGWGRRWCEVRREVVRRRRKKRREKIVVGVMKEVEVPERGSEVVIREEGGDDGLDVVTDNIFRGPPSASWGQGIGLGGF